MKTSEDTFGHDITPLIAEVSAGLFRKLYGGVDSVFYFRW